MYVHRAYRTKYHIHTVCTVIMFRQRVCLRLPKPAAFSSIIDMANKTTPTILLYISLIHSITTTVDDDQKQGQQKQRERGED